MNELVIDELYEKTEKVEYASFWPRVGASLLDGLILVPITIGLGFYSLIYIKSYILGLFISGFGLAYKVWMEKTYGATLGKKIVGINVTALSLESLNYSQVLIRNYFGIMTFIVAVFQQYTTYHSPELLEAHSLGEVIQVMQFIDPMYTYINYFLIVVYIIDCLIMFGNDKKQTLHDKLGSTITIKNK